MTTNVLSLLRINASIVGDKVLQMSNLYPAIIFAALYLLLYPLSKPRHNLVLYCFQKDFLAFQYIIYGLYMGYVRVIHKFLFYFLHIFLDHQFLLGFSLLDTLVEMS